MVATHFARDRDVQNGEEPPRMRLMKHSKRPSAGISWKNCVEVVKGPNRTRILVFWSGLASSRV